MLNNLLRLLTFSIILSSLACTSDDDELALPRNDERPATAAELEGRDLVHTYTEYRNWEGVDIDTAVCTEILLLEQGVIRKPLQIDYSVCDFSDLFEDLESYAINTDTLVHFQEVDNQVFPTEYIVSFRESSGEFIFRRYETWRNAAAVSLVYRYVPRD